MREGLCLVVVIGCETEPLVVVNSTIEVKHAECRLEPHDCHLIAGRGDQQSGLLHGTNTMPESTMQPHSAQAISIFRSVLSWAVTI